MTSVTTTAGKHDPAGRLATCPCCGLAQIVPEIPARGRACCPRCETTLHRPTHALRSNRRAAAVAASALILYPLAVGLPLMSVERLGHVHETSIIAGAFQLLAHREWLVGLVVLLCSVIFPLFKLGGLLILTTGALPLRHRHRALTYHIIEWTGRWGMLDVLLVAILVALVKLGDVVDISAGPGAAAFATVVILSLIAAACFDPHSLWAASEERDR